MVATAAYGKVTEGLPEIETGSLPPSQAGVNDSYPTETSCATRTVAFSRHRAWPDAGTSLIGSQYG